MSNGPVREIKYQTCACGKVCKGLSGFQTHTRKCDIHKVRKALDIWCYEHKQKYVSDAALTQRYDEIRAALIERGALDPDGEPNFAYPSTQHLSVADV
jgi:hypothetical protein